MAITITNRQELLQALSALGLYTAAEQGVFDGLFGSGSGGTVTAADITDATTVGRNVLKAADAAAARTAIGAGTSSLALGTTASTAKAGNYAPTTAEVGTALKAKTQINALAAVSTPDATDATSAATLANANKAAINLIIAALKA
ncbi:hypothetical protein uav_117 [Pseudomonas phage UAVern]|uniref:Tail fiber protein n=1 Tax=Pseudomonas phage UAVern TaxID=2856997 RepID=A0A975UUT8_9CAUD|nr:hypothetical protein uav_117 [Pseudomonas phage UAVern]